MPSKNAFMAAYCCLSLLLAPTLSADDTLSLNPVVVTATRTARTADDTLASVTVITREDIERQQVHSVAELLQGIQGISVSNNGGPGKVTSVFIRGAESDQTLVLIDGVKVGSAATGTFPFQDLPPEQIERIEIVRGPRSSLYGSEAIGGVIQIFTRKGEGRPTPTFNIGAGSNKTQRVSGGINGGTDKAWYNLNLAYETTNGFNACTGDPVSFRGCGTFEPDNDGYDNRSITLGTGYRFTRDLDVSFNFLKTRGDVDFDGDFFGNESDTILQVAGGKVRFSPVDIWEMTLSAGQNRDENNTYQDGVFISKFDTKRNTASFQNDVSTGGFGLFTLGVDYQNDKINSTTTFAEDSRHNTGVFGQYQARVFGQSLQGAIRVDDNEQFGSETTGSVAWGYTLVNQLQLMASWGTAYKAPTFNELYFPGFGNPDLDPEKSRSYEIGVSRTHSWGDISVNAYQTKIDDLIGFDAFFSPVNIDKARIRGLEAGAFASPFGWDLNGSFTLMDPKNRSSGPNRGKQLVRRPKRSFRLDLDRRFARLALGATLIAQSKRYDDLANTRKLDAYQTLDLRAEYPLLESLQLAVRVGNVLDEDYETAEFFPQEGRSYFVSLRYRPGPL